MPAGEKKEECVFDSPNTLFDVIVSLVWFSNVQQLVIQDYSPLPKHSRIPLNADDKRRKPDHDGTPQPSPLHDYDGSMYSVEGIFDC